MISHNSAINIPLEVIHHSDSGQADSESEESCRVKEIPVNSSLLAMDITHNQEGNSSILNRAITCVGSIMNFIRLNPLKSAAGIILGGGFLLGGGLAIGLTRKNENKNENKNEGEKLFLEAAKIYLNESHSSEDLIRSYEMLIKSAQLKFNKSESFLCEYEIFQLDKGRVAYGNNDKNLHAKIQNGRECLSCKLEKNDHIANQRKEMLSDIDVSKLDCSIYEGYTGYENLLKTKE